MMDKIHNYILVWLDPSINEIDQYYQKSIAQLQNVIHLVKTFVDRDQCIDFVTDIENEIAFMVISSSLAEQLVSLIALFTHIYSIYVLENNQSEYELKNKQSAKVRGTVSSIDELCYSLKRDMHSCDFNNATISIMHTDDLLDYDLNRLDSSFMYSQILKDILINTEYDENYKQTFVNFCRQAYHNNNSQLKIIGEFDEEYHMHSPIWWYTRDCFLYYMLNRALRTQEVDIIIKMGFFLKAIHEQLQTIYNEATIDPTPIIVYRGQGMFKKEYDKLIKSNGGLLAFNSFLSTSKDYSLALFYAESAAENSDLSGILFKITVDTMLKSCCFAELNNISYFGDTENEILFPMHTIFRIEDMKQLENGTLLVELILTKDNDPQLRILTEYMRSETIGADHWSRLAHLMMEMGEYDKAEEMYTMADASVSTGGDLNATTYINLGMVKHRQGDYQNAILLLEKGVKSLERDDRPNFKINSESYANLGLLYFEMGKHRTGLELLQKSLEIKQKHLPSDHRGISNVYQNMAGIYHDMGNHPNALTLCNKALAAKQICLPSNHPELSTTYNCIGDLYITMGQYSTALNYFQKVLEIRLTTLPSDHPSLATVYNNIAIAYWQLREFNTAISYSEKAIKISEKVLHPLHPDLANRYGVIGAIYNSMGDHSTALTFLEKAQNILKKTMPFYHRKCVTNLNNIGFAYQISKNYSAAVSFYQRVLDIQLNYFTPRHPDLARTYNNMGRCNLCLGEYSKAISLFQQALDIRRETLGSLHPGIVWILEPLISASKMIGDYTKALYFQMNLLEIIQTNASFSDAELADCYDSIGVLHTNMKNYATAIEFYKKAISITEKSILSNDHVSSFTEKCDKQEYQTAEIYPTTLLSSKKPIEQRKNLLSKEKLYLSATYKKMGHLYDLMNDSSNALTCYSKALEMEP